jgi:hypothetical protein
MRITRWGWSSWVILFAFAGTLSSTTARSQQPAQQTSTATPQTESPADAARRARDQKKSQPKPAQVWDNDNIPKRGDGVSVVGSTETPAAAPAPVPGEVAGAQAVPIENKGQLDPAIQQAKDKIASLEQDVDIAQRKFTLDSDMYYGKTNYQDDKAGKAALDVERADIENKKKQLQDARDILASLQAKASPIPDQTKQ